MTSELRAFLKGMTANPAESFADVFLAGDASGIKPVTRQAFLAALPSRAAAFARAGLTEPVLTDLAVESLDEHYLLARTDWNAGPRNLVSSYLLHRAGDGGLRVVVYLNHQGWRRRS
jgi:hypothetical protein